MRARHASLVILVLALLPAASAMAPQPLPPAQAAPCAHLRLNEFLPQPVAVDWNHDCAQTVADQWVELHNPDEAPCDAGGWYLARGGPGTAVPYTIPGGTLVGGHGYTVLYAGPFSLHPSSGEVWLWQDGGTPQSCTYYYSLPDCSINRLDSDPPVWDLSGQTPPSPGQANGSVGSFPEPATCTPTPGPPTDTPTPSPTPTDTPTATAAPAATATATPTASRTASATRTASPTRTPTVTRTPSATRTATTTRTPSATRTPSPTVTGTRTRTFTPTPTVTGARTLTAAGTPTAAGTSAPLQAANPPAHTATASPTQVPPVAHERSATSLAATPPATAPAPAAATPSAAPAGAQTPALPPLLWLAGLSAFFGWVLVRRPAPRK